MIMNRLPPLILYGRPLGACSGTQRLAALVRRAEQRCDDAAPQTEQREQPGGEKDGAGEEFERAHTADAKGEAR